MSADVITTAEATACSATTWGPPWSPSSRCSAAAGGPPRFNRLEKRRRRVCTQKTAGRIEDMRATAALRKLHRHSAFRLATGSGLVAPSVCNGLPRGARPSTQRGYRPGGAGVNQSGTSTWCPRHRPGRTGLGDRAERNPDRCPDDQRRWQARRRGPHARQRGMASRRAVGLRTHLHDHDQQPRSGRKAWDAISFLHYAHAAQPDKGIFPHDFGGRAGRRRHLRRRGRDRGALRRVDRQQGRGRAALDRHNLPAGVRARGTGSTTRTRAGAPSTTTALA